MPGQPLHIVGHVRQVLEVGLVHRFADPIAGRLRRDRPAGVVERLKQLGGDVVRAVLIADDRRRPRPCRSSAFGRASSVSLKKASIRSTTRLARLDSWPSQIGVPKIRMSAARMRRRMSGQASPSPSSERDARLDVVVGDADRLAQLRRRAWRSSPAIRPIILSVDDGSPPLRLRVQLMAIALSATASLPFVRIERRRTAAAQLCAGS